MFRAESYRSRQIHYSIFLCCAQVVTRTGWHTIWTMLLPRFYVTREKDAKHPQSTAIFNVGSLECIFVFREAPQVSAAEAKTHRQPSCMRDIARRKARRRGGRRKEHQVIGRVGGWAYFNSARLRQCPTTAVHADEWLLFCG